MFIDNEKSIGVNPFLLRKSEITIKKVNYAFDAKTTRNNLLKLLRAYQL